MKRNSHPGCFGFSAAHRRSVACLAILALLAVSAGRAQADDEPLESIVDLARLERNGWNIPLDNLGTALGEFVRVAGRAAILVDQMSRGRLAVGLPEGGTGWCLLGTVMKQGEERSILNLGFGQGPRVFVSAGCNQATDIDLEVTDQTTKQSMASDKQPDATPVCLAATGANTLYTVCASLPRSRGAALTLTGILRVEAANAVQLRIQPAMAW